MICRVRDWKVDAKSSRNLNPPSLLFYCLASDALEQSVDLCQRRSRFLAAGGGWATVAYDDRAGLTDAFVDEHHIGAESDVSCIGFHHLPRKLGRAKCEKLSVFVDGFIAADIRAGTSKHAPDVAVMVDI